MTGEKREETLRKKENMLEVKKEQKNKEGENRKIKQQETKEMGKKQISGLKHG